MERRSEKYEENIERKTPNVTRTSKNRHLYDEINYKIGYEEIENLDTQTRIDLSELTNPKAKDRESYHKTKDLVDNSKQEVKVAEPEIVEEKIYDINAVLEEAKKNRIKYDELEKKRKLRENNYATLADANDRSSEKEKSDIDEKELTDLINTITSHTLVEEIKEAEDSDKTVGNDDILSELLATNVDLHLEEGIAKEFTVSNDVSNLEKADNSFYTQSMDLSDQDFELSEELERDKKIKIKIIIVVVVILLILSVVAFLILKRKGIL